MREGWVVEVKREFRFVFSRPSPVTLNFPTIVGALLAILVFLAKEGEEGVRNKLPERGGVSHETPKPFAWLI